MDEDVTNQISAWYTTAVSELTGEKVLSAELIDYLENIANIEFKGEFTYTDNGTEVKFDNERFNNILASIIEVSKKDLEEE